jgi:hypothetical protein
MASPSSRSLYRQVTRGTPLCRPFPSGRRHHRDRWRWATARCASRRSGPGRREGRHDRCQLGPAVGRTSRSLVQSGPWLAYRGRARRCRYTEMLRTKVREVRKVLWVMLGVAVVLPVAVPASIQVHDAREKRATAKMLSIAQRVKDPPRMSPLVLHHDCNGDALIRCSWTTDQDVDALALRVKADLAKSADMTTRTVCDDIHRRVGGDTRSCFVQVGGGSHAVTIFLDPYVEDGSLLGTMYVVQAN